MFPLQLWQAEFSADVETSCWKWRTLDYCYLLNNNVIFLEMLFIFEATAWKRHNRGYG